MSILTEGFSGYVNSQVPEIAAIEKSQKLPGARELYPGFPVSSNPFLANLQKVPAKYYLEIRKGAKIDSVVNFPYDPQFISYSRPTPVNIRYTLGGVYRETNTIRKHNINLGGRSGIAHRIGYNRRGQFIYVPGQVIFNEFDEFLKRYTELCTQLYGVPSKLVKGKTDYTTTTGEGAYKSMTIGASSGNAVQMILRCLDEDLHLVVEPTSFAWNKNVDDARFDCRWEMDFQGYGYPAYGQYKDWFMQALDRFDQIMGLAGGFVGMVGNMVNNLSNDYIGRFRKSINNFVGTLQVAADLAASFEGIVNNAVGVVADYYKVVNGFRRIGNRYIQMSDNLSNAFDSEVAPVENEFLRSREVATGTNRVFTTRLADIETQASALHSAPAYETGNDALNYEYAQFVSTRSALFNNAEIIRGNIPNDIFENRNKINAVLDAQYFGSFLANERNLGELKDKNVRVVDGAQDYDRENAIRYPIKAHEDLYSVAHRFLGPTGNWEVLKEFNKWIDARRNQFGEYPTPGDIVLIPREEIAGRNKFAKQGDVYGHDVFAPINDLVFNDNGDIELVGGKNNLQQSIRNNLLTFTDQLIGFGDYGLPLAGNMSDTTYAAAIVRDQLIQDPRIIDVRDIVVERDEVNDTQINISCKVQATDLDDFEVRAPLFFGENQ